MCNKREFYIAETVGAINIWFKSRMNQLMVECRERESIFKFQRHVSLLV